MDDDIPPLGIAVALILIPGTVLWFYSFWDSLSWWGVILALGTLIVSFGLGVFAADEL